MMPEESQTKDRHLLELLLLGFVLLFESTDGLLFWREYCLESGLFFMTKSMLDWRIEEKAPVACLRLLAREREKRRLILGCVRCRRRSLLLFAPPASLVSLPDLKSSLRSLSSCLASREGSRERESTKDILQTRVKNRTWIEWRLRYKFRILFLSLFFFFYFRLCWTSGWWWRREKEDTGTRTRRETRERRTLGTTETNMNVWKDLSRGLTVEQNRQQIIRGEQEGEEIKEDVRHERKEQREER